MSYRPEHKSLNNIKPNSWEEQDKHAATLYADAMDRFLTSEMYQKARQEEWHALAFRYAREMIEYQARKLAGCSNVGLSWQIITNWDGLADDSIAWRRMKQFKESCNRNISDLFVRVSIPSEAIAYWQNVTANTQEDL